MLEGFGSVVVMGWVGRTVVVLVMVREWPFSVALG